MDRHKSTAIYKEKQRILTIYLSLLILTLAFIPIMVVLALPPAWIYLPQLATALLLTLLFLISYSNPVEWGWLMFGRKRTFSGNPWQSRVQRELTHMDAHEAVEEQMAYEEALYHRRPEALIDVRETREELKARRRVELPKIDPGKIILAEGVLKCPQCDTPYAFDKDNPICVKCGTRLHSGVRP